MAHFWKNYPGLRERVFVPRPDNSLSHRERGGVRGEQLLSSIRLKQPLAAELLQLARTLRQESTDAEALMWQLLRDRQIAGCKFRRQHPLEPYVLDFYCHELKLAVEVDGGSTMSRRGARTMREESPFWSRMGFGRSAFGTIRCWLRPKQSWRWSIKL